eukprot:665661-Amphidinium_carterae.1
MDELEPADGAPAAVHPAPAVIISSDDENQHVPAAPPADVQPDPLRFLCDTCGFASASNRGLQSHKRRAHNFHTPLSLRVATPKCEACDLNFGTRARILDHFRTSPRCATWVLANVDPMTPTTFARVLMEARTVNETHTRVILPKAGRKPVGDRPPQCGHVAAFADEAQRMASEQ